MPVLLIPEAKELRYPRHVPQRFFQCWPGQRSLNFNWNIGPILSTYLPLQPLELPMVGKPTTYNKPTLDPQAYFFNISEKLKPKKSTALNTQGFFRLKLNEPVVIVAK